MADELICEQEIMFGSDVSFFQNFNFPTNFDLKPSSDLILNFAFTYFGQFGDLDADRHQELEEKN